MKIEIGESLMLSYLKHVKKCLFYQTNWKVSSNWNIDENSNDKLLFVYGNIVKHTEFSDIFKQSRLDQLIKQSEIDVIGWDGMDKIYVADIAFHEAGLNYGSKIETKNRVFKKILRSYLTLLAYFPNKKYELIFASPKVNNATEDIIKDYLTILNKDFTDENVVFKYLSNDSFRDEIFIPTINEAENDSDTNELFMRAIKLSNLFKIAPKPVTQEPKQQPTHEDFDEIAKIKSRIPNWFLNRLQYNSRILYAFINLYERNGGNVTYNQLMEEAKIPKFKGNFDQMKNFGEKNHGKIFEQIGENVYLWKKVEHIVWEAYKKYAKTNA